MPLKVQKKVPRQSAEETCCACFLTENALRNQAALTDGAAAKKIDKKEVLELIDNIFSPRPSQTTNQVNISVRPALVCH